MLYLPTEKELALELERERRLIEAHLAEQEKPLFLIGTTIQMKLKFKKQPFQTNEVNAVADCFAGQQKKRWREKFSFQDTANRYNAAKCGGVSETLPDDGESR